MRLFKKQKSIRPCKFYNFTFSPSTLVFLLFFLKGSCHKILSYEKSEARKALHPLLFFQVNFKWPGETMQFHQLLVPWKGLECPTCLPRRKEGFKKKVSKDGRIRWVKTQEPSWTAKRQYHNTVPRSGKEEDVEY